MRFYFGLTLFAALCVTSFSYAGGNEKIKLSRAIIIELCDNAQKCTEHPSTHSGAAEIELKPFNKGNESGLHGEEKLEVFADGNPFKSEIFVNKTKTGYSIYAVLRSGEGTKRPGTTHKAEITNFSDFKPLLLTDKPLEVNSKKYQAKLKITPVAK